MEQAFDDDVETKISGYTPQQEEPQPVEMDKNESDKTLMDYIKMPFRLRFNRIFRFIIVAIIVLLVFKLVFQIYAKYKAPSYSYTASISPLLSSSPLPTLTSSITPNLPMPIN